jgi:histidinol-phosphate aminotransferase
MFDLNKLVRQNILNLEPYSSARDEFKGSDGIFLDANENPFGEENRYPDPYQRVLKEKLSVYKNISTDNIFIGNGSDEIIDLAFRIFCNPGQDKVLTFSPTYGMYDVSANINNAELIKVPLDSDFQIDLEKTLPYLQADNLKIIFICSPNNPTGNLLNRDSITTILKTFKGLVIIDEAYIDFSSSESWMKTINDYPNLMVLQTFSKAWGLANSRVGVAYTSADIVNIFNKVKPPYNVSGANQTRVIKALSNPILFESNLLTIKCEKIKLINQLQKIKLITNIYPSDSNFLLVKVKNADLIYEQLVKRGVIIRNRNKIINNCIRITVGTKKENQQLIKGLKNIKL